jgi:DUF4097 and DUF4098 domain-containing protein YvlB
MTKSEEAISYLDQCSADSVDYRDGKLRYAFDVSANSDPNGFFFRQTHRQNSNSTRGIWTIKTAGKVLVQTAPKDQVEPVVVELQVKLSHDELANSIHIRNDSAGLVFESDLFSEGFHFTRPCISLVATIFVSPSADISAFSTNTENLPVVLDESLKLTAENLFLGTVSSNIKSNTTRLNSRKIEIQTTSGTVSGLFPLADLLSIKTISGDILADVDPKEADDKKHDGVLIVRTTSGTLKVNTATDSIPSRNFITEVGSVTGAISGSFLLGTRSTVITTGGSINTDFYTAGKVADRSLTIESVSGAITSTVDDKSYDLGSLRSNLGSRSGSIDFKLPAAWEGQLKGISTSGSISITGNGVEVIKDTDSYPGVGRTVVAKKGDGKSFATADTISGQINVRVG